MKIKNSISLTVLTIIFSLVAVAQSPQGISHQAVVRDAANNLVINSAIGVRMSILQGSATGPVVYSETHSLQSNANGLISFVIGEGIVVSGVFADIDWADGPSFVETEVDPSGGVNYSITGVSQMLSVPYAFVAEQVSSIQLPALLVAESGQLYHLNIDGSGNLITSLALGLPCPGQKTVTDADGNVYNTVLIGNQCWIKENLKTTKYSNGSNVAYPTNNTDWQNNTVGAYGWYNNDISNKDLYGAIYNWYAVNNGNGLCPTGWRVPSNADFNVLLAHLNSQGYPGINAGMALKSCRQVNAAAGGACNTSVHPRWDASANYQGTNVFGFSALPGGWRFTVGGFTQLGASSFLWSAIEQNATFAWLVQILNENNGFEFSNSFPKNAGASVRCIKN